jgi:hypothetical protein
MLEYVAERFDGWRVANAVGVESEPPLAFADLEPSTS